MGSEVVVMVSPEPTVIDSGALAVWPIPSVTRTSKLKVPLPVGIPVMAPLAARVRPAGSDPVVSAKVYESDPPVAATFAEYESPTAPPGSVVVVMLTAGRITMDRSAVPAALALSFTSTLKLNVPLAVGVPVRTPPEERLTPVGSAPDNMLHSNGAVPPDAVRLVAA